MVTEEVTFNNNKKNKDPEAVLWFRSKCCDH